MMSRYDRIRRHAVFAFKNAAHPDDSGGLELLQSDALADQILWVRDALASVDEYETMAKPSVQENRDCGRREPSITGGDVRATGHLRHVEFQAAQEAPMPRRRIHGGQHGEIDAVGHDSALL